jgi:hypothetical protein
MNKYRKKYYAQMLIVEKQLSNDILRGYYKSKFATDICEIIKQETSKYTSQLEGKD